MFNRHVPALNVAGFSQSSMKCFDLFAPLFERLAVKEPNYRQCGLLRPRDQRPCRRTTEPRDELAPFYHSIT
jgi:hypothetical protein